MGGFRTELTVTKLPGGMCRLVSPLVFDSLKAKTTFTVPAGFLTDFASVPRLPLAYMLFGGVADEAAVIHDYLYSTGIVSRSMADAVFSEAMKECGTAAWRRGPMWLGVRIAGWMHYKKPEESIAP